VVEIKEITRMSDCKITNNDDTAGGIIEVIFTAKALIVSPWDYIVGVKILKTSPMIVGESNFTPFSQIDAKTASALDSKGNKKENRKGKEVKPYLVCLFPTPETKTLEAGQMVCARIVPSGIAHTLGKPQITCVGAPVARETTFPVYTITDKLKPAAALGLRPVVEAIKRELRLRSELDPNGIAFFENLLYRHDKAKPLQEVLVCDAKNEVLKYKGIAVAESKNRHNLVAFVERAIAGETQPTEGAWGRPLSIPASSPFALNDDALGEDPEANVMEIKMKSADAMSLMLMHVLNALYLVRGMVQTYSTKELMKSHMNVFAAISKTHA
jgi:hypothetical protein